MLSMQRVRQCYTDTLVVSFNFPKKCLHRFAGRWSFAAFAEKADTSSLQH
jgi:hypothetical protein